jgi:hypothetical protein
MGKNDGIQLACCLFCAGLYALFDIVMVVSPGDTINPVTASPIQAPQRANHRLGPTCAGA